MQILELILTPLVWLFQLVFEAIHAAVGSYGLSIVLLSLVVTIVMYPIASSARKLEEKEKLRQERMAPAIAAARVAYKGRERFEKIDEIYQENNYHPIKSMASMAPLMLQIPFLLAALFLLVDYPPLVGRSFLFIPDLSLADGLLPFPVAGFSAINLLPISLTAVALLESHLKPEGTAKSRQRFLIVALVLLALIYSFPAAVGLYWLCSNIWSLLRSMAYRLRPAGPNPA